MFEPGKMYTKQNKNTQALHMMLVTFRKSSPTLYHCTLPLREGLKIKAVNDPHFVDKRLTPPPHIQVGQI